MIKPIQQIFQKIGEDMASKKNRDYIIKYMLQNIQKACFAYQRRPYNNINITNLKTIHKTKFS